MYHVASSFDVRPERHQDFIDAALKDRRDSLANEPGTQRLELIRDGNNLNLFHLNEAYADKSAFEAHKMGPYFKRFFDDISGFVEGPTSLIEGIQVEAATRQSQHVIDPTRAKEPSQSEKKHFIGCVRMQRFVDGVFPASVDVVAVFFESAARTRPHIHTTAQVLHFIKGTGFVAFPGEENQEVGEGGVVIVPAGSLHMHGATSRGEVWQLAVKGAGETDWAPILPAEWSCWRS